MKLCMFHPVGHPMERGWPGRIDGERVVQLAAQTLESYFTGGGTAREHAVYPRGAVRLVAPVLHPPAVRIFDDQTRFAFANPAAIVGPEASITGEGQPLAVVPRLAAVIGAGGAIGGLTGFLEWRRPALDPPKDRDFALGLGPVVATAEELDGVTIRVDGGEPTEVTPPTFDWERARQLALEGTVLRPGDLLAGPALASEPIRVVGDVQLELAGLGVLRQFVR
jgi:hypothetical protein